MRHSTTCWELPLAVTALVGRDEELVELRQLLAHTRLLTLVGTGGVGKTRLAIELARIVQDTYTDGVRLVQMAALADGLLVPQTVAVAAGVRGRPDRPLLQQVAQTLKEQHLLLILDNCEHVLEACVEVAERVLTTCPRVTILATSRERLGLTGETRVAGTVVVVSLAAGNAAGQPRWRVCGGTALPGASG